jgi:hypothetical protein
MLSAFCRTIAKTLLSARAIGILLSLWILYLQPAGDIANDPGLGWHLATGQVVVHQRDVPKVDPFLFNSMPRPWIADQWLGEVVIYTIYTLGSFPLLCASLFALFLLTYWNILYPFIARHTKASPYVIALSVLIAMKLALIHLIIRPVPMSFALFTLVFASTISLYRAPRNSRITWSQAFPHLCILSCAFVAWANTHASFILGLGVIASAAGAKFVSESIHGEKATTQLFSPLPVALFFALVSTLINPYGVEIFRPLILPSQWIDLTSEWNHPTLSSPEGTLSLLSVCIIAITYLRYPGVRSQLSKLEILFIAVLAAGACNAVRFTPYLGIVTALPLCVSLQTLVGELRLRFSRPSHQSDDLKPPLKQHHGLGALFVSIALIVYTYFLHTLPLISETAEAFSPSRKIFPITAVTYLGDRIATDSSEGVLTEPNWGGTVTWYGRGRLKATLDDRDVLFTYETYINNERILSSSNPEIVRAHMTAAGLTYVLVSSRSTLAEKLNQSDLFTSIYRDETAAAFTRRAL